MNSWVGVNDWEEKATQFRVKKGSEWYVFRVKVFRREGCSRLNAAASRGSMVVYPAAVCAVTCTQSLLHASVLHLFCTQANISHGKPIVKMQLNTQIHHVPESNRDMGIPNICNHLQHTAVLPDDDSQDAF